ncbi:phenylalanine--tRNA ligase subunit beta [Nocardioides marmoriginsengisoli]|uniref:Phenylalanine--tRNA ligase beta subunit n=1 Tax=Nocardioides marmoriginsengisoli TaxID=661483 RepID=A0A3N0CMF8_9ACTN|nr:phenylalanine--tRNA ligase subunit beta [Nocardioides marmoriginsengisoli]RNL64083.1 phenylalanine--tRNA ligase subunit beta [Nocardioides marmoriginsengisoli]
MKAPVSWIREYVDLPAAATTDELAARLTALGLKLEALERPGADITGPLVIGRVLTMDPEPQKNGKTINWCTVDVADANGTGEPQGIVCGAHNFAPGDLVVVVLPGGVLPGGFEISERKTYGHLSAGMICSSAELGLGDDGAHGIIVLPPDAGKPGDEVRELLHLDDEVIEFEINPDRAYALSLRGVAREAALAFEAPYADPALRETPAPNDQGYPVVVDDPAGCPVFVARTVSGFDPAAPTPRWMARRIQLAGMRPISLAVDVTNYVMLELGHPIHGYDADKLAGPIRVRRATEGERLTTLDGAERTLASEDLVVTDDTGPIGLGGVMGGSTTEMSETTTRILVEVASWNPTSMFRTGKRHKLTSEAGKRNERGVDPTIPEAAADRVVELLVAHGGGTAEPGVTKIGVAPEQPTVTMEAGLPARITGMEIPAETVVDNLLAVGCEVTGTDRLTVVPPPWRPDITDPFDLVEEVARIVGYDNVPSVLPPAPAGRGLTQEQLFRRRVGRTLAGAGFVEVLTFPFLGETAFDTLGLPADDARRTALRLANPLSAEAPLMATTLLPGALEALARNLGRGNGDLALFEAATVTLPRVGAVAPILPVDRRPTPSEWDELNEALPDQPLHLALALTGDRDTAGWWGPGRKAEWADAVEAVREVAAALGIEVTVRAGDQAPWHPGRCAELFLGDLSIGYAGELHPRVCKAAGVPERTAVAEVNLSTLLAHAVAVVPGPEFSTFPVAKEDVALLLPVEVPAEDVAQTLREGAGALCESVRLFDIYTGEQVQAGHRSLAFALRFRAPDRTLTEAETGEARGAAVALAAERHGAVQR